MNSPISPSSIEQTNWTESKPARDHSFSLLTILYGLAITVFSLSLEIWIQERSELDNLRVIFNAFMLCGGLTVMSYFYSFLLYPRWLCKAVKWLENMGIHRETNPTRATHLNNGVGSLYLRLGAIVFGIVAVFYCGLQFSICLYEHSCKTSDILDNILQPLLIFVQLHFVFCKSQMRVLRPYRLAKLGAMHMVAVNLWTWFRMFLEKQKAHNKEMDSIDSKDNDTNDTEPDVLYRIYDDTKILMSTCVVEYSVIAAAVMLVLWVNIGGTDEDDSTPVNHRNGQQMRVDCRASHTGMFVGLVYIVVAGASVGTFDAMMQPTSSFISWSVDVALLAAALFACVVGMWRMRRLSYVESHHGAAQVLDEILLVIGLTGEVVFCAIMLLEFFPTTPSKLVPCSNHEQLMLFILNAIRLAQVLVQTLLILFSAKLVAAGERLQDKPGKQFITFLLIANVVLFVLHSYKTQQETVDGMSLFPSSQNLTVLKAVNPLVIFFRFHSSVCLADVWKHTYSDSDAPSNDGRFTVSVRSNNNRRSSGPERASSVTF